MLQQLARSKIKTLRAGNADKWFLGLNNSMAVSGLEIGFGMSTVSAQSKTLQYLAYVPNGRSKSIIKMRMLCLV